jgi:hypothetical protein
MKKEASVDYSDSFEQIFVSIDTYQLLIKKDNLDEEQKDILGRLEEFIVWIGCSFASEFDDCLFSKESHAAYSKLSEMAASGDEDARGKLEILKPYFMKAMEDRLKEREN